MPLQFTNEKKNKPTSAEKRLWQLIKEMGLCPYIHPQHTIGWFIVDYLFANKQVIVELDDGNSDHERRDRWLIDCGYTLLRFRSELVFNSPDVIFKTVESCEPPTRTPHHLLIRAQSKRRIEKGLMLLEEDKILIDGRIVSLESLTTAQQENALSGVVYDVKYVRHDKSVKCPKCSTKLHRYDCRCENCCSLIRWGWLEDAVTSAKEEQTVSTTVKVVEVSKGRQFTDGKRCRPKCPNCQRGLAGTWKCCPGCAATIVWK
jgi:very-short-patch-repair endonuclease